MVRNTVLPIITKPKGMPRKPYTWKSPEWREDFLKALEATGNVRAACLKAGIPRDFAYKMKNSSEKFREQWQHALDNAIDSLELTAWDRARKLSDSLLIFLLKSHRPELYSQKQRLEHTGADGAPIQLEHSGSVNVDVQIDLSVLSDDELISLQTIMQKVGAASVSGLLGPGPRSGSHVIDGEYAESDAAEDDDSDSDSD